MDEMVDMLNKLYREAGITLDAHFYWKRLEEAVRAAEARARAANNASAGGGDAGTRIGETAAVEAAAVEVAAVVGAGAASALFHRG